MRMTCSIVLKDLEYLCSRIYLLWKLRPLDEPNAFRRLIPFLLENKMIRIFPLLKLRLLDKPSAFQGQPFPQIKFGQLK